MVRESAGGQNSNGRQESTGWQLQWEAFYIDGPLSHALAHSIPPPKIKKNTQRSSSRFVPSALWSQKNQQQLTPVGGTVFIVMAFQQLANPPFIIFPLINASFVMSLLLVLF